MANQFVIELPNRPGALADLSETLAARGVDLRAIGGGGNVPSAIPRRYSMPGNRNPAAAVAAGSSHVNVRVRTCCCCSTALMPAPPTPPVQRRAPARASHAGQAPPG